MDADLCVICFEKIRLEQIAFVKDCQHAYCVTCILQWANYKKKPVCPQCKHPFDTLYVRRSLDGCISDYLIEESVCLLLRAPWFITFQTDLHFDTAKDENYRYFEVLARQQNENYTYTGNSQSNRWVGEASSSSQPVVDHWELALRYFDEVHDYLEDSHYSTSSSRPVPGQVGANGDDKNDDQDKNKASVTPSKYIKAKREKRAIKKEAANRAAAEKHQRHLKKYGRAKAATD